MTSREFYKLMDSALGPECERLGLRRLQGTTSQWNSEIAGGRFLYQVGKGVKNPYIPYVGGRFKVDCNLGLLPDGNPEAWETAISYMEYYSDEDLDAMSGLRDGIIEKIVRQSPKDEFERQLFEAGIPMLNNEIGSPCRRHQVFELPYLDSDDVLEWGQFLALRLEKTVVGVKEKPIFFMAAEE